MSASVRTMPRSDASDVRTAHVEALVEDWLVVRQGAVSFRCANGLASLYAPRVGDAVLWSHGPSGERYVTGVVSRGPEAPVATLTDGTTVHVDAHGLAVRDSTGALVFEHRAGGLHSVLHAPRGHLELRADGGDITLHAAGAVRVQAATTMELDATQSLRLGVAPEGVPPSQVTLAQGRATVSAALLDVRATRAEATADEGRLVARTLTLAVETQRVVAGLIDTTVTRAVTRARNVFAEVEELAQTQAGRMRTVVKGNWHVFGRRAVIKADDDVKLKGDKIHLG